MNVILLREAREFLAGISPQARNKFVNIFNRLASGERNAEIFKKLDGTDIWEIRAQYESNAFRLFAFWDANRRSIIVATHGIIKKTQKTPRKEIAKAERIRNNYLTTKDKSNV